jgi:hypothetical protein
MEDVAEVKQRPISAKSANSTLRSCDRWNIVAYPGPIIRSG